MIGSVYVSHVRATLSRLTKGLWLLPSVAFVGAIGTATLAAKVSFTVPSGLGGLLTTGGAAGARDLVQTVASTSLTVATFVFSVTIVALQVAASQYSPRLPRQFIRDRATQAVMAVFVFTFVYSLATVRSIRADAEIVPQFAVTLAFFFALCTTGGFVYFINHIVSAVRVERILRHVEDDTVEALEHVARGHHALPRQAVPSIPVHAVPILAQRTGVLRITAARRIAGSLSLAGTNVALTALTGEQVFEGRPVGWAWANNAVPATVNVAAIAEAVDGGMVLSRERAVRSDPAFGLMQIVDIALRAASPAVNDPTTTRAALRSAEVVIRAVARCGLGDRLTKGPPGSGTCVFVAQMDFQDYLEMVTTPIRQTCATDTSVIRRLLRMLEALAWVVEGEDERAAIEREADLALSAARRAINEETDLSMLHGHFQGVREVLHRDTAGRSR